jgi:hypothetical protein
MSLKEEELKEENVFPFNAGLIRSSHSGARIIFDSGLLR